MIKVNLGKCCTDCLLAVNQNSQEYAHDANVMRALWRLDVLQANERLYTLHIGDELGFSWSPCDGCGSPLGGERHELFGLREEAEQSFSGPMTYGDPA